MRRTSVFVRGENLGAGGVDFRRALKLLMGTKEERHAFQRVFLFWCHPNTIDANISIRK